METRANEHIQSVRALAARLDEIDYHVNNPDPVAMDNRGVFPYISLLHDISWELGTYQHHIVREMRAPFGISEYYKPVLELIESTHARAAELAGILMQRMEAE